MLYYHNLKQLKPEGNSLKAYIEDSVMKKKQNWKSKTTPSRQKDKAI